MRSVVSQLPAEKIVEDVNNSIGAFTSDKNKRLGNQDSAHGVIFGTMAEFGPVVVKPHAKAQRAKREASALEAVSAKGFIALEPLLVAKGGLATYLVTRQVPDLRHLGQLDWSVERGSPRLHALIAPTLNEVADTVGSYHEAEVVHGDYQPKNAMRLPGGAPVYGDAEKTSVNPPREIMTGLGNKDIALFGAVALHNGLLSEQSPQYRVGYLEDELLAPYLKAVDPERFAMSIEERERAIVEYWLEGARIGGVATWPGRQMQGNIGPA